MYQLGIDII